MRHQAVQPRRRRAWRAAGGNAGTHGRLHHEEGRRHAADTDDERRADRRMTHPVEPPTRQQHAREGDADDVVRRPADQPFMPQRRRGRGRAGPRQPGKRPPRRGRRDAEEAHRSGFIVYLAFRR